MTAGPGWGVTEVVCHERVIGLRRRKARASYVNMLLVSGRSSAAPGLLQDLFAVYECKIMYVNKKDTMYAHT